MVSSTVSTLTLGGPAEVVLGEESFPAQTAIAIRRRQATIQSKRKPPGITTSRNRVSKTGERTAPGLDAKSQHPLSDAVIRCGCPVYQIWVPRSKLRLGGAFAILLFSPHPPQC